MQTNDKRNRGPNFKENNRRNDGGGGRRASLQCDVQLAEREMMIYN